jgi:tetratricopeptide (TPR) repeat protein
MKALDAQRVSSSQASLPAATAQESKLAAEREFSAALAHFKSFRYADASPGFVRAAELLPQSTEYKLYARWNHILQKGAPMQVHDRGEAWRLALAAIAADPNSAFAHYVAGAVAQEDGQKPIAHRYLSRAVALDPQLVDAQRRLRIVERREA